MNDPIPSPRTPEEIAELERALDDSTLVLERVLENGLPDAIRMNEPWLQLQLAHNRRLLNAA